MRTLKLSILSLGLVAGFASSASAQVKFDDVISTDFSMVSDYAGYSWGNAFALNSLGYWGSPASAGGFYTALHSGSYVMSNAGASPLSISKSTGFNLTGGYFASNWTNGLTLTAKGYNNGVELYNKSFQLNWSQAQYLNLDMYNVDNVVFSNVGGTVDPSFALGSNNGFAFDDLDMSAPSGRISDPGVGIDTVVPEPMTMSLVGFGLLAVGGLKARRRHALAK